MKDVVLSDVLEEVAALRRLLETLPEDRLGWKPHPRSWTLGGLAAHAVNVLTWQSAILELDEVDMATIPAPLGEPADRAELLDRFERHAGALRKALAAVEEETFPDPWTLRHGERVVFTMPRIKAFRRMGFNHMIHHRAQLTVYLRLMDEPVPGLYGPSADDLRPR